MIADSAGIGNITVSSLTHNLSQFQKEIKVFREKNNIHYQEREAPHSNRTLLANALSSVAQSSEEKQRLNEYKSKIRLIEGEQKKLGIKKKSCNH